MTVIENRDPNWAARIRVREKLKRRRLKARAIATNRAKYMWLAVRSEAKRKGVKFDLTVEWFDSRINAGTCEMSGLPFHFDKPGHPNTPSVDRRAAGGHYVQANCRMILRSLNWALGHWGEDYICSLFKAVIERKGA